MTMMSFFLLWTVHLICSTYYSTSLFHRSAWPPMICLTNGTTWRFILQNFCPKYKDKNHSVGDSVLWCLHAHASSSILHPPYYINSPIYYTVIRRVHCFGSWYKRYWHFTVEQTCSKGFSQSAALEHFANLKRKWTTTDIVFLRYSNSCPTTKTTISI